ncbi:unnamed protein product (macronuclear) [Paramecium tetraurelia]|uniref:Uncharacterized protein n=1 Tax=Paramecium tetraurelia TaxID=5888 RepID=A0BFT1_PARTE|nr:uncharacterized protein GSPATT00028433001 [Paramecium tetraurelia]CAK57398.1 unnamed protein product [Paramecium tetraurelia]|eukprot:XP_001424796.1 hypothetical protein (macronuclear) [Paramecium tetraurelia strain d4-2]
MLTIYVGYKILDHICYSICGDQIVTVDEECDDGNLIIGDGCHFCNYSCQDSCLNCVQGECLKCKEITNNFYQIANSVAQIKSIIY